MGRAAPDVRSWLAGLPTGPRSPGQKPKGNDRTACPCGEQLPAWASLAPAGWGRSSREETHFTDNKRSRFNFTQASN